MALAPANDRKRVKVYELKNNDWYDRGTGFCAGQIHSAQNAPPEQLDARIVVLSEDEPDRTLLETRITKDDGYQKQQETLIVWTESNGVDMALSFQEAEGCAGIWEFVSDIQTRLVPEDGISDDLLDPMHPMALPEPTLGRLDEVENAIRAASCSPAARDEMVKFMMSPEQMYIRKLAPLVEMAEDLESTQDLHRLCTIMKHLILLNDTSIIEFIVTDQAIMGVVGALEYDPDFPSHRANHRQYLSDTSKFKEVVPIDNIEIKKKIHHTYRLLYLKDVVLARILDDPTFSVLNSLIFFNQVDIVSFLQSNKAFLDELFAIFTEPENAGRRKEAVLFIQNCCAVSKNIQAPSRAQLYQNFISHGLFDVITFSLRHHDAAVRVAGTDVLVSLIDHDAPMVRGQIYRAMVEKTTLLTDTLIELLLVEVDLGVKSQMADAIKILLDPASTAAGMEMMNRQGNPELMAKQRGIHLHQIPAQTEKIINHFYEEGAKRLFQPLKDLEHRSSMAGLTVRETTLYTHLVEILSFFVRQHSYRSKPFVLGEHLHSRIAQLLLCPQKYMKLAALKWFRTCIGLQDEFHNRQFIAQRLFEPILNIVYETMPRDNLLNSACLEMFEHVKRDANRQLITHLAEHYRERLMGITYVDTFQSIVAAHDKEQQNFVAGINRETDTSFNTTEPNTPDAINRNRMNGRQVYSGLKEPDADEDAYFNADDDEEEEEEEDEEEEDDDDDDDDDGGMADGEAAGMPTPTKIGLLNGQPGAMRSLVDYPDDDDAMDIVASLPEPSKKAKKQAGTIGRGQSQHPNSAEKEDRGRSRTPVPVQASPGSQGSPSETMSAKRRREEEDEDELGKLMGGTKRRNSSTSSRIAKSKLRNHDGNNSSSTTPNDPAEAPKNGSVEQSTETQAATSATGPVLRRKANFKTDSSNSGRPSIKSINLANAAKNRPGSDSGNGDSQPQESQQAVGSSDKTTDGDTDGG